jgi:hypothetical protein
VPRTFLFPLNDPSLLHGPQSAPRTTQTVEDPSLEPDVDLILEIMRPPIAPTVPRPNQTAPFDCGAQPWWGFLCEPRSRFYMQRVCSHGGMSASISDSTLS